MTAPHGAIVLAAGASRRLGQPKQLVEIDGETLLQRTVRAVQSTLPLDLVVVLGHQPQRMTALLDDLAARWIVAAAWQDGMGESLRCGVAALEPLCGGVLVVLCDQPALTAAHLQALLRRWHAAPQRAAASAYAQTIGVPALIPRAWLQDAAISGERGARDLLRSRPGDVDAVANAALARDIDLPRDL